ncbi:MAG: hypothetical protein HRT80_00240 [Henriciella sp.]|nr:hypothetical protein [Henriciella sp.]
MKSRLKEYYVAEGEWEHEYTMEKLVDMIDDTNLDLALSFIPEVDPWIEENANYALGTTLIILDELVRERGRCIPQALFHLKRLRSEYQKLGPRAAYDLREVDEILDQIYGQMH